MRIFPALLSVVLFASASLAGALITEKTAYAEDKPALTITVKDITLEYNGQTQGLGDVIYDDPAEIAQMVTVSGLLTGDDLTSIMIDGQGKEVGDYPLEPGNAVINDDVDNDTYNIIYVPGTLHIIKAGNSTTDSEKKTDDGQTVTPASWILNPNEKQQLSIVYRGTPDGTCAGYQKQGAAAKAVFDAETPKGWSEAFEFNLLNKDRQPEMTLKQGSFTLYIPTEWQKTGRQFAIVALTKGGQTILLPDTDTDPNTITVSVGHVGYAFRLIYKD